MRVVSKLRDERIESLNLLVEMTIEEYLSFAKDIIHKNPFQRRRVRSSSTVYSLLKADLQRGCIIPPIVLALTSDAEAEVPDNTFEHFISKEKEHLVILDGLQRTLTIIDLVDDLKSKDDTDALGKLLAHKIRAEFYLGLNRLGILYRMLTLNTGQTPMSLRQQIEILYLDYLNAPMDGVKLIRETDEEYPSNIDEFNFKSMIDGFNSYLDRNELPIDRTDLLENIESLEKLSRENQKIDLFGEFTKSWSGLIRKMDELCSESVLPEDFISDSGVPFGRNIQRMLKKDQAVAGFGAALGKLKDHNVITGFEDINRYIHAIEIDDPDELLLSINRSMAWIKSNAKRIGNAQRSFFMFFFREVFNPESDAFQAPEKAVDSALKKYQSQYH